MFDKIRFFNQDRQWKKLLFTQFLLAFCVMCSGRVTALSIKDYCLSEIEPPEFKTELYKNPYKRPNEIWLTQNEKFNFSRNSRNYFLQTDYKTVQLIKKNKGLISQIKLPFKGDSWIRTAYLTKDNWLYVSANKNNYAVEINLENPDNYLKYIILPKIYPELCSKFRNWFEGSCHVQGFSKHSSSNKVFLSGYMATADSQKRVVMEIAGGKTKILNTSTQIESISHIPELNGFILQGTKGEILFYNGVDVNEIKTPKPIDRILRYISKLNGVLLQGTKGEVLFYDGVDVNEIPSAFPKQSKKMRDWYLAEIATFGGKERNYDDERIFLTNFREGAKTPHLFMELKAGLLLEPISFPKKSSGTEVALVKFPDDSTIWAMMYGGNILAEIDGEFQNVITVPKFHTISWNRPLTSPIAFEVGHILGHIQGRKNEKYYIKKASPSANCEIMLDPDNPVKLTVD